MVVSLMLMSTFAAPSHAQIKKSTRIELNDNTKSVDIGDAIYVLRASETLRYESVITRYENNLIPTGLSDKLISLGAAASPSWIIFSITNNTDNENWVLDFGNVLDGRYGLVEEFFLRNHSKRESFFSALKSRQITQHVRELLQTSGNSYKNPPAPNRYFYRLHVCRRRATQHV